MLEIYTKEHCESMVNEDITGKIVVLKDTVLSPEYRKGKYQLWKAGGGFGCAPDKIGRAVFAKCLDDGEEARWDRGDFIGILKDEFNPELQK